LESPEFSSAAGVASESPALTSAVGVAWAGDVDAVGKLVPGAAVRFSTDGGAVSVAVIAALPFDTDAAWAELGAGADVAELVDAAPDRSAESADREFGGSGLGADRKIPTSPPETARAGGACVEAETDTGEMTSVIRFSSVKSRYGALASRSTTTWVMGGSA